MLAPLEPVAAVGTAALPLRGPLRPRPVPGRRVRRPVRRGRSATCAPTLMEEQVQSVDASVEGLGRADSIAGGHRDRRASPASWRPGPTTTLTKAQATSSGAAPRPRSRSWCWARATSGCSTCAAAGAAPLEELDEAWPALVPGLAAHQGIAFVAGIDAAGCPGPSAPRAARPRHRLGRRHRPAGAVRCSTRPVCCDARVLMAEAPDLYVNSAVDPLTHDVAAFEGLVGSHGGLGGWQDHAVLLAPADLMAGAPRLHRGRRRVAPGPPGHAPSERSACCAAPTLVRDCPSSGAGEPTGGSVVGVRLGRVAGDQGHGPGGSRIGLDQQRAHRAG